MRSIKRVNNQINRIYAYYCR